MISGPTVLDTRASGWTILVRLLASLIVFFPEGLQKLVFRDSLEWGGSSAPR
jgi:hypothetical protein